MKIDIVNEAEFVGIEAYVVYNDYSSFNLFIEKESIDKIEDIVKEECLKYENMDSTYNASLRAVYKLKGIETKKDPLSERYPYMYLQLDKNIVIDTPIDNIPKREVLFKEINQYVPEIIDVNGFVNGIAVDKLITLLNQIKKGGE